MPWLFFDPQLLEKQFQTLLGTILAAKPDRAPSQQVAHDDAVGVPAANGDFVDADYFGCRRPDPAQLFPHVLLLQFLDRFPMQPELAGDIRDRRGPAPPPDQPRKAFGIKGIIRQPSQSFAFHLAATLAGYPTQEHLHIDAVLTTRQVSNQAKLLIVKAAVPKPTNSTGRFF